MECRMITEENIEEYRGIPDADIAENIGRKFYRALALHEDTDMQPRAVVIWKLVHMQGGEKPAAEIRWLDAMDEASAIEILKALELELADASVGDISYEYADDNEVVKAAFEKNGFTIREKESRTVIVTVAELVPLLGNGKHTVPSDVKSIDRLTFRQFHEGVKNCRKQGRLGALEDFDALSFDWFEPQVSCCVQAEGKVNAFLLVHRTVSDRLAVKLLAAWRPATNQELLDMIRFAILQLQEHYSPQTQVVIRTYDEATDALARKLFVKAVRQTVKEASKKL